MFYHFLSFSMVTCIYNKRCSQYLQRSLQQHVQHLFVGIKKHLPTSTLEDLWDFHQRCSSFSPCSSRSNPAGIWGRGWCQLKSWDPKCSQKLKPVHFHHFVADTVQSMFFFPETFKFCRILCRSPMIRPGHRAPLKIIPKIRITWPQALVAWTRVPGSMSTWLLSAMCYFFILFRLCGCASGQCFPSGYSLHRK